MGYMVTKLAKLLPELEMLIDWSSDEKKEKAAYICREGDGYELKGSCTGEFCEVSVEKAEKCEGTPIALFHTHPTMKEQQKIQKFTDDEVAMFIEHYGDRKFSKLAARKNIVPSTMDIVYPVLRDAVFGEKMPELICQGNYDGIVCYQYQMTLDSIEWLKTFLRRTKEEGQYAGMEILKKKPLPYRDEWLGKEIWLRKKKL